MDETQETPPSPPPATGPTGGGLPGSEARTMGMLAHLLAIPFSIIGPLIIWLIKKDEDAFIDDQGKEALNWEITMAISYLACFVLTMLVIGAFLLPLVLALDLIFNVVGAIKANGGVRYRYPFALRLIH